MKKLLYLSALLVCVSACCPSSATKPSAPVAAPASSTPVAVLATHTPYPTYTPPPTYTPMGIDTLPGYTSAIEELEEFDPRSLPTSTPYPTYTLYPTYTPYATYTPGPGEPYPTPAPEPTYEYPAPHLLNPPNGSEFGRDDTIVFEWDSEADISGEAIHHPGSRYFFLQIWKEEESLSDADSLVIFEKTWSMGCEYYPGRYRWRVFVRGGSFTRDGITILSPPSATWSFSWLSRCPPCPCLTPTPTP